MTRKLFVIVAFTVISWNALSQGTNIPVVNYSGLEPLLHKQNDTVYVVNFWATWCKPCVEELPHFIETANDYRHEKVKFVFVSLDFTRQLDTKLVPFVTDRMQGQKVILLNDPAANTWINKIDPNWTGAIPATLIYKGNSRSFVEGTLSKNELINYIKLKQ